MEIRIKIYFSKLLINPKETVYPFLRDFILSIFPFTFIRSIVLVKNDRFLLVSLITHISIYIHILLVKLI